MNSDTQPRLFNLWHQGQRRGPFAPDELRRLIENGDIPADTPAAPQGSQDWQTARDFAAPENCGQVDRNSAGAAPVAVHVASENPFGFLSAPLPGRAAGRLTPAGIAGVVLGVCSVALLALTPWAAGGVALGVASWLWARR